MPGLRIVSIPLAICASLKEKIFIKNYENYFWLVSSDGAPLFLLESTGCLEGNNIAVIRPIANRQEEVLKRWGFTQDIQTQAPRSFIMKIPYVLLRVKPGSGQYIGYDYVYALQDEIKELGGTPGGKP